MQLREPVPGFDGAINFLLAPQKVGEGNQSIGTSRHHVMKQRIRVRTHAPAGTQGRIDQRNVILDDDVEFAQRTVDFAVDEKEICRFPCHIRGRRLGLQRAVKCHSLVGDVPGYLIRARQIEPVAGIVRVQFDGASQAVDGRLRIAGNKFKVAPEPMAIVCISRRETYRQLQLRQFLPRREDAGGELFADKKEINAGKKNHAGSELPTSAGCKWNAQNSDPGVRRLRLIRTSITRRNKSLQTAFGCSAFPTGSS